MMRRVVVGCELFTQSRLEQEQQLLQQQLRPPPWPAAFARTQALEWLVDGTATCATRLLDLAGNNASIHLQNPAQRAMTEGEKMGEREVRLALLSSVSVLFSYLACVHPV